MSGVCRSSHSLDRTTRVESSDLRTLSLFSNRRRCGPDASLFGAIPIRYSTGNCNAMSRWQRCVGLGTFCGVDKLVRRPVDTPRDMRPLTDELTLQSTVRKAYPRISGACPDMNVTAHEPPLCLLVRETRDPYVGGIAQVRGSPSLWAQDPRRQL